MAEKLIIKNFVGIKDLEIEVKKINVLIGPQASGKSICAKLLFYFKNFHKEIISTIGNNSTKRDFDSNCTKRFATYFPKDSWGNDDFFIRYEIDKVFIEIKGGSKNKITLTYSDLYNEEILSLRKIFRQIVKDSSQYAAYRPINFNNSYAIEEYLSDYLRESFCEEAFMTQIFIPAGRILFAYLQNNIFSFLSSDNNLDSFLKTFGSIYENLKDLDLETLRSTSNEHYSHKKNIANAIDRLIEKSLYGKHIRYRGRDYIETIDYRKTSLHIASSGQQEILPLISVLTKVPFSTGFSNGKTLYIEEPEAHLFPKAQKNVIELIATVFNYHEDKLQFFITTHSPYTLTSFNNLLQAGILYKELDAEHLEELEKIVPKYKALSTDDFSAYALADGKCTSIINPETGLIDATIIDSVSEDLMIEFDNLINLI